MEFKNIELFCRMGWKKRCYPNCLRISRLTEGQRRGQGKVKSRKTPPDRRTWGKSNMPPIHWKTEEQNSSAETIARKSLGKESEKGGGQFRLVLFFTQGHLHNRGGKKCFINPGCEGNRGGRGEAHSEKRGPGTKGGRIGTEDKTRPSALSPAEAF